MPSSSEPRGWRPSPTMWGLGVGLLVGLLLAFGSFWQLIVVLFFALLGFGIGWWIDNRGDVREFVARRRR